MSRMEATQLSQLVNSAEAGGYTLPPALVDTYRTLARVRGLTVPPAAELDHDTAAARVVHAIASGESIDLLTLGSEVQQVESDRQATAAANRVLAEAVEQAANHATNTAADLTEQIITDHLRPALEDVYAQARDAEKALAGYGLEPGNIIAATGTKGTAARAAYLSLGGLVARRQVILNARRWANTIGHREPQQDAQHLFSSLQDPTALLPGWKLPARIPRLPIPEDPTACLLWFASPASAPAKPWLPTMAEQDAAWWALFGEGVQQRADGALLARARSGQRV